jgi:hypothetical protein
VAVEPALFAGRESQDRSTLFGPPARRERAQPGYAAQTIYTSEGCTMSRPHEAQAAEDPDADPEMKSSGTEQPDQAEGEDSADA